MRLNYVVSTLGCAITVAACGDAKSPTETVSETPTDTRAISVALCGPTSWAAHMDDGGTWTRVSIISGKAVFNGTEKQALAMVSDQGSLSIEVIYTTATTLSALTCGIGAPGTKNISGTVANLGSMYALVSLGYAIGVAGFTGSNFSLFGVTEGALDLVATRSSGAYGGGTPDRMIHRRAQTLATGSTIALDFDATEAFALESHAVTVTGAGTAAVMLAQAFRPAAGTLHMMQAGYEAASPTVMVPASRLAGGDLHQTSAFVLSPAQGFRGVLAYYKDPADKTLTMGPSIGAPTMTTLVNSPLQRVRAEIAAQAEYGSGATVLWEQDAGTHRSYTVTMLKDYLGALPAKWTLDMPDLSQASGFMPGWGLNQGSYDWAVQLIDGSIEALIGDKAKDGDVIRFVMQTSDQSALVAGAPRSGWAYLGQGTVTSAFGFSSIR